MSEMRLPLAVRLAVTMALVAGSARAAITLEDPTNFQVKNTFSGTALGLPGPLGGLMFSSDGTVLYVVGASESSASALYAVPVTRDPVTSSVTAIGPAAAITKAFDGTPTTAGLDAGFDVGPAGTLFYTYWSANYLGERPGGIGGAETQFNMATVGVPSSIAGLTFSPRRVDPATDSAACRSARGRAQTSTRFRSRPPAAASSRRARSRSSPRSRSREPAPSSTFRRARSPATSCTSTGTSARCACSSSTPPRACRSTREPGRPRSERPTRWTCASRPVSGSVRGDSSSIR